MSDMEDIEHDYVKVPDINGALAAKDQGNEFYKKKEYVKALEMYTKAHELHPTNAIGVGDWDLDQFLATRQFLATGQPEFEARSNLQPFFLFTSATVQRSI